MNHTKKILALLRAELKKIQGEVYDEEGMLSNDADAGVIEGLEVAISIVENYIEQNG